MTMRDKDSSDFDLDTFVDLFDTALTSDNPAVKKAFKNLLMVTAIVHAKGDEFDNRRGPLRRLVDDINNLNRRVNDLENQKIYPGGGYTITPVPMPGVPSVPSPTWTSPNTTGQPPNWPPGSITCSTTDTTLIDPNIKLTTGTV